MIQHFFSTIFPFFDFATQLFSILVTSSNLQYLRSSAFHRQPFIWIASRQADE